MIAGTVTGAQAGLSLSGLTAQIAGTNLSSAVSDAGTFQIPGVPSGSVQLQFRNSAVNATANVSNVKADEIVQLRVQVTSTSAVIVEESREGKVALCHAEGNGSYHLIDVSLSAEPAHRAHGDGKVGDPVPGQTGRTFDSDCRPVGPGIDIEKFTNGEAADSAPGPSILVGSAVNWRYVVTNTGTVNLTSVAVVDDRGVVVSCGGQTTLAPAASMTCTGSGVAVLGQYRNLGTVTANWAMGSTSGSVTDADLSHYLGIAVVVDDESEPKVTLCHRTGAGFYNRIEVGASAEPAHMAHGDGKPLGPVPGQTGKVFTASCAVQ